jgi:RNA polymerase sigma factor (sigma-70 family)
LKPTRYVIFSVAAICDTERLPEAHLLERVRAGDQSAFEVLVIRFRAPLLAHCRAIVGDAAAEDAVQQTFISAWRALRDGGEVLDTRAWLFTIAHRAALALLRKRDTHARQLPDELPGGRSSEERLEESLRVRAALSALAALPSHERDALVASSLHQQSGRELARSLGISEVATRQLIHRARSHLRSAAARVALLLAGLRLPASGTDHDARASIRCALSRVDAPPVGAPLPRVASLLVAGLIASSPLVGLSGLRDHAKRYESPASARPRLAAGGVRSGPSRDGTVHGGQATLAPSRMRRTARPAAREQHAVAPAPQSSGERPADRAHGSYQVSLARNAATPSVAPVPAPATLPQPPGHAPSPGPLQRGAPVVPTPAAPSAPAGGVADVSEAGAAAVNALIAPVSAATAGARPYAEALAHAASGAGLGPATGALP